MQTHRGWTISYDPPPIPVRHCDFRATHPDFDGEANMRTAYGADLDAVKAEIDNLIDEDGE